MNQTYETFIKFFDTYGQGNKISVDVTPLKDEVIVANINKSYVFIQKEKEGYIISCRNNALTLSGNEHFYEFVNALEEVLKK